MATGTDRRLDGWMRMIYAQTLIKLLTQANETCGDVLLTPKALKMFK